jgi:hypothetical protein
MTSPMRRPQRNNSGRRVAVFGGGPGGLSAAHELSERGFNVTVYERHRAHAGKLVRSGYLVQTPVAGEILPPNYSFSPSGRNVTLWPRGGLDYWAPTRILPPPATGNCRSANHHVHRTGPVLRQSKVGEHVTRG